MGDLLSPRMLILLLIVVAYIIVFPVVVMRRGKKNTGDNLDETPESVEAAPYSSRSEKKKNA